MRPFKTQVNYRKRVVKLKRTRVPSCLTFFTYLCPQTPDPNKKRPKHSEKLLQSFAATSAAFSVVQNLKSEKKGRSKIPRRQNVIQYSAISLPFSAYTKET